MMAFAEFIIGLLNPRSPGRAEMRNCDRKRMAALKRLSAD
jgi:hypothetical protein